MNTVIKFKPLVCNLAIPLVAGAVSSYLAGDTRAVYEILALPSFAPPAGFYSFIWTVLYLMMGYSAYRVFTKPKVDSNQKAQAASPYFIQLFLNFLWSPLFFRLGLLTLAGCLIIAMIIVTIVVVVRFYTIDRFTVFLMVPYLLWLIFAMVLNFTIAALN
ncbi:TspO/MBR family protein [Oscillospiraceae bacterium MB08-C2-2]|nr:TspO/MBR family protein [Oscillospiraceae bacterium MB08-C2-2]